MYEDALSGGVITTKPGGNGGEYLDEAVRRPQVWGRPDADVRREVLRALLLDSMVPLTVDASVHDGFVTLSGRVGSHREREDAKYLASCVPGVLGIEDELLLVPGWNTGDEPVSVAVKAALARTAIADLAELTVDAPCPATVVLSGAVTSRSDHDLAVATAWSVADVEAVDDCIQVEG
jgi:osmotically-inducible protein OsmY